MKNAKKYEPKIKKLLRGAPKPRPDAATEERPPVEVMLRGILQADATDAQAEAALAAVEEELVDYNELRVAQAKEITACFAEDFPEARRKATAIIRVLQGIFNRSSAIDVTYMIDMPKRDLRRHLMELGMGRYAAAYTVLNAFGGHAVCVDDTLVGCLAMDGYVDPGCTEEEAQGFALTSPSE